MTATVEIRLVGGDLERTMREMRLWLDHRKVVPRNFRQSTCPGGLALQVEFALDAEATNFASRFTGRVLGTPPEYLVPPLGALPHGR